MRLELQRVLAEAGYRVPNGGDIGEYAIMVKNADAVPRNPDRHPAFVPTGFQLILLDERLRPTRYARFQDAAWDEFERECRIFDALCADAALAGVVPQSRTAATSRIRVQVSDYLAGARHFEPAAGQSAEDWLETAAEVCRIRDLVCARATVVLPEFVRDDERLDLLEEADPSLQKLRESGEVPDEHVERLAHALKGSDPLQPRLQHGDFWGQNLLFHGGSWWLIDYADLGLVHVPLYDYFHLVQSTSRVWGDEFGWLSGASGETRPEWRSVWARLLDEQAAVLGLTAADVGAIMVFYVVRLAAHRLRTGIPQWVAAPVLRDLGAVAEALGRSVRPESLLHV